MRLNKTMFMVCVLLLFFAVLILANMSGAVSATDDGAKVFAQGCSACHNDDNMPLRPKSFSTDEWNKTIDRMIVIGAEVTKESRPALLDYLIANFGPTAKPTVRKAGDTQDLSQPNPKIVRTAVIGGMAITTDLWKEISKMFEDETGYRVVVVAKGPRPGLAEAMRKGKVDLLTMHSGDVTTDLVADGYAVNMRPWIKNDLIIIGPKSDPAKIKGMEDGVAALKRIAETKSNFIDMRGIGPRELGNSLWKKAGVDPLGSWVIKDESTSHADILSFVESKKAYMIIGRLPFVTGKLGPHDNLDIMVEKDPVMRRPYIVMEANPDLFPGVNVKGARTLSDYLLSEKIQRFIGTFGKEKNLGVPQFRPVKQSAQ